MSAFAGFVLSIVFQMAHVVDKTDFIRSNSHEAIETEDEWAIHQMKTTANFAMGNKFLTWFLGGLNYQVEHHLFPRISHVHYPDISKIVKATCEEFNITYIEFKTLCKCLSLSCKSSQADGFILSLICNVKADPVVIDSIFQ